MKVSFIIIKKMKVEGVKRNRTSNFHKKTSLEETKRKTFVQQLIDELRPPFK